MDPLQQIRLREACAAIDRTLEVFGATAAYGYVRAFMPDTFGFASDTREHDALSRLHNAGLALRQMLPAPREAR